MKKLLSILLLLVAFQSYSQTTTRKLLGLYPNGMGGYVVDDTLKPLGVSSSYLTAPNDSTIGFDSSKVVTEVILNSTSDSIYVYKGSAFVRAIKLGTAGGGGAGWGTTGIAGTDSTVNFLGTTDARPIVVKVNGTTTAKYSTGGELIKYGGLGFGASGFESAIKIIGSNTNKVPGISFKNTNAAGKNFFFGSYADGSIAIQDSASTSAAAKFFSDHALFGNSYISTVSGANVVIGTKSGIAGVWVGVAEGSTTTANYAIYSDGSSYTSLNAPTGGNMGFRIGNSNRAQMNTDGSWTYYTATATPATPATGQVVEWWDGTNKRWKKSDGSSGIIY